MKSPAIRNLVRVPALLIPVALFASCSRNEDPGSGENAPASASAGVDYPLMTCVVSGEELGSMGDPVVHDYKGTTVKFCCKNCIPKFEADPEAFLSKLK